MLLRDQPPRMFPGYCRDSRKISQLSQQRQTLPSHPDLLRWWVSTFIALPRLSGVKAAGGQSASGSLCSQTATSVYPSPKWLTPLVECMRALSKQTSTITADSTAKSSQIDSQSRLGTSLTSSAVGNRGHGRCCNMTFSLIISYFKRPLALHASQ